MSVARGLQIYGGDVPTNWAQHTQTVLIQEPMHIYQLELWIGVERGHRGDLLAALWVKRAGATDVDLTPLHVRAWDHYDDTSKDGLIKNLAPLYYELFPGDALVLTTTGSQQNSPNVAERPDNYWRMLGVAHITFTSAPGEPR